MVRDGGEAAAAPCDACLGDERCWVCLGSGRLESRMVAVRRGCRRCSGTGVCPACQPTLVIDLEQRTAAAASPARDRSA